MAWPVFFTRHAAAGEEAVKPGHGDVQTESEQRQAQLFERDVLAPFPDTEDVRPSLLQPTRAHVTALGLGSKVAGLALLRPPADRRRRRHTKARRSRPATHPTINRRQKPPTQIHR